MSENEIQNFVVHNTSTGIAKAGALILDGTLLKYHNGTSYITLGDSDIATSSAAGVVELFSDTTQTVAANSVTATASRTYGVQLNSDDQMVVNVPWEDTTIANTNTFRTVSVDTNGNGSVNDTLDATETLVLKKGSNITLAESAGVITISSTDTNTQLNNAGVIGKVLTGLNTGSGGAVAAADTILAAFGKLENRVALNDAKVTNSQVSTDVTLGTSSHDYLSISGQAITLAAIDLTTDVTGDLPISEGGTGQSTAAAAANALLNTSQGGALTIGDSSDTITIAGDLTVEGSQTIIDSTTVATGDNMLELAKDNTGNATDFGWYGKFVDSGTKYAGMNWDASATKFVLGYGDDAPAGTIAWDTAGHLEVGKLTTTDLVIGGHTISDVDITSEDSGADDHLMTAAAIVALIADNENSFSTASGVEDNADVTDATNVAAAGAIMDGDFTSNGLMKRTANGSYTVDTNTYSTATGVANNADVTPSWVPSSNPNYLTSVTTISGNAGSATVLADGAVGGVKVFHLDNADGDVVADQGGSDSTIFTITHGMGAGRFYKVEVVEDSGNYDTVYADVQRPSDTTIKITFGAAVANGAYRAMVQRME